jgi:hypothetical protein
MIIASRVLTLRQGQGEVDVPVHLQAPEQIEGDWICRFEIGWPEEKVERWAAGVDAMQALVHALHMIGAEIYASEPHEAGKLAWLSPGAGYGFPVPGNIRDLLVGGDKRFL